MGSQQQHKVRLLARTRRVVVKLGSSVVTTPSGVHRERVGRLSAELARMVAEGHEVIVVTSGARAAGLSRLGLSRIPQAIAEQQAAAAIGQIGLMSLYERFFSDHGKHVGQVLLTAADVVDRTRYLNARHTLEHLLRHGVVPIVNENDSVAIDELKFGDNDRLSALVAGLVTADLLILLTDVAGVYAGDPRSGDVPLLDLVEDVDALVASGVAGGAGTFGTGGMASKVSAAASACHRGIPTVVASGLEEGTLAAILDPARSAGTLFLPRATPISQRKHWIAYVVARRGTLHLDDGAVAALSGRGGSLLAVGITAVSGAFRAGDCVSCLGPDGKEVARGLVAYDAADCERIRGRASREFQGLLGYHVSDEVIHRDDLVLLHETNREQGADA
jgi:glutamate 5-kinase